MVSNPVFEVQLPTRSQANRCFFRISIVLLYPAIKAPSGFGLPIATGKLRVFWISIFINCSVVVEMLTLF